MTFDPNTSLTTSANDSVGGASILTVVGPDGGNAIGLTNSANFSVAAGATLNLKDPPVAKVVGQIAFLFSGDRNVAGEYLSNAGTVNWTGTAVPAGESSAIDMINVPVFSTGTLIISMAEPLLRWELLSASTVRTPRPTT